MRMRRIPAVITAAVIGAGLTACAGTGSHPPAVPAAATTGPAASTGTPGAPTSALTGTPASSSPPATSSAHTHSAAAEPSVSATASPHPATSQATTSSGAHDFTVPTIPGDNVVAAHGSYTKIGTARVKVTVCATQTGTAFAVGAEALAYNAGGASQNVGPTILTGPGNSSCASTTFLLYTAHLKVHAFIGGSNGLIQTTGPVLTLY
jgi:hypothetical protein